MNSSKMVSETTAPLSSSSTPYSSFMSYPKGDRDRDLGKTRLGFVQEREYGIKEEYTVLAVKYLGFLIIANGIHLQPRALAYIAQLATEQ